MKKILVLTNVLFFLTGCAELFLDPTIEEAKPYFLGKQIGIGENYYTNDHCIMSVIENSQISDAWTVEKSNSLYRITDIGYATRPCGGGYYLKAEKENDSREYRIYTNQSFLANHSLPNEHSFNIWVEKEEFNKMQQKAKQEEKRATEQKEAKKKAVSDRVKEFIAAAPKWEDLKIAPDCPLPLIAGSSVTLKCKNTQVKTLSGNRLSYKMTGCFMGDVSFIFQYGSEFVVLEQLTAEGRTRYSQFENLTGEAYNYCLMGAATFNGEF